jgi:hypothetical protein
MRFATSFVVAVLFTATASLAAPIVSPAAAQLEVRALEGAAPVELDFERRSYYHHEHPQPHHHHHRHEERDLEDVEARSFGSWFKKAAGSVRKAMPTIKKVANFGFKAASLVLRDESSGEIVTVPLAKREPEPEMIEEAFELEARSFDEPEMELEARSFEPEEELELEARSFEEEEEY